MNVQSYRISDVDITIRSRTLDEAGQVRALVSRLFDVSMALEGPRGPGIIMDFDPGETSAADPEGTMVFADHGLLVFRTAEGYALRYGFSALDVILAEDRAIGCLDHAFRDAPLQCRRVFFFLPLLVLFPRYGLYGIHASGLENDGVGYLLAGNSRQGKTTLTLALLRAGWNYVSDDTVMLSADANGVEARSFRRGFACDAATIERFPELRRGTDASDWKEGKVLVDADTAYSGRRTQRCKPRVLLFPEITPEQSSRLLPLDATAAFVRLVRHSPFACSTPAEVTGQMNLFRALVAGTSSYRLLAGADVHHNPEAVSRLLRKAGDA